MTKKTPLIYNKRLKLFVVVMSLSLLTVISTSVAQVVTPEPNTPDEKPWPPHSLNDKVPEEATEDWIIEQIKNLQNPREMTSGRNLNLNVENQFVRGAPWLVVSYVDTLHDRYPESLFTEDSTILQLKALEQIAQYDYRSMARLAQMTREIKTGLYGAKLKFENDFYWIRAYQLAAQHDGVPIDKWLPTALSRYDYYITTYPEFNHTPKVFEFWIRDLVIVGRLTEAEKVLVKFKKIVGSHDLIDLCTDRIELAKLVGEKYNTKLLTTKGDSVKSADYLGNLLLIHYWSPETPTSLSPVYQLIKISSQFGYSAGLEIIGVVLSQDQAAIENSMKTFKVPWPQCISEFDVGTGKERDSKFHRLPGFMLIGADGRIKRVAHSGDEMILAVNDVLSGKK